jgi:hypothetical protein
MPRTTAWIFTLLIVILAPLLLGTPAWSQARAPLLIDFESFPGPDGLLGTADDQPAPPCPQGICGPLSSEYASLGLVFTSGTLGQGDLFPGTGVANHFVTSSPLDVTLSKDTFSVTIDSYSYWTAVLWAFDARGQLIGTKTLQNPTPGVAPVSGTLSLISDQPIRRFTVRAQGCSPADASCPQILNLDNLKILLAGPEPPEGAWLVSPEVPGFQFKVRITSGPGQTVPTRQETPCIAETLCVSGAVPGRTELLLRVVGPRPNGYLWPILTRLSPSQIEVWIEQRSTGLINYYVLPGSRPGDDTLPGLFDRHGFLP